MASEYQGAIVAERADREASVIGPLARFIAAFGSSYIYVHRCKNSAAQNRAAPGTITGRLRNPARLWHTP